MMISITPMGGLGNRMIEHMAALALGHALGGAITYNSFLPEWGSNFDQALHDQLLQDQAGTFVVRDIHTSSVPETIAAIRASGKTAIVLDGFFQRINLFRTADIYKNIFPIDCIEICNFRDDELVINVRAAELRNGIDWYPLVPVNFYKELVALTGLKPVFLGQLEDCRYLREIQAAIPHARMIPSAGALTDFNRLRQARHLCIAVSTFSWLAGWLSDAAVIHYPLHGFLHPRRLPKHALGYGGFDLAPASDSRYSFHLLPVIFGAPEAVFLDHTNTINPISKPVPHTFVQELKTAIPPPAEAYTGFFNEAWYVKQYPEAAWEISAGRYHDARHHYGQTGRQRGYLPHRPLPDPAGKNIAAGKRATQSSRYHPAGSSTLEDEASAALDGVIDGRESFHTDIEDSPWWRVDLGAVCLITEIRIFNRLDNIWIAQRSANLAIDIGLEQNSLNEVYRRESMQAFGGIDGEPLILRPPQALFGRFINIRLLTRNYLHLDQVEIYGEAMFPPSGT